MNPYVLSASLRAGRQLLLGISNGESRTFDPTPYLELRDEAEFALVPVVDGSLEWPGEIDLSYDTLYLRSVPVAQVLSV